MKGIDEIKKKKIIRSKHFCNYTIFIKNEKNENKITSLTRLGVSYKKKIFDKKILPPLYPKKKETIEEKEVRLKKSRESAKKYRDKRKKNVISL